MIKINYPNYFPRLAQTEFWKNDLCKLLRYRVVCVFIKNKQLACSHKILRLRIWTDNIKVHQLSIKSLAKTLVFFFRLIIDRSLELLHVEIVSLWIKTIVNLSQLVTLKALSSIPFEKFCRWFVWTSTESAWQEHLIKIPIISKETWQTISYGISVESTVKFTKPGFSVTAPHPFKLHIKDDLERLLTWKNNSTTCYRLSLLSLLLSNLRATVTYQKCTIISNFEFNPLRVELGPFGSIFDETNWKNNCYVHILLVINRNETILYVIHKHSEKRFDIHWKVAFGFKYIIIPIFIPSCTLMFRKTKLVRPKKNLSFTSFLVKALCYLRGCCLSHNNLSCWIFTWLRRCMLRGIATNIPLT